MFISIYSWDFYWTLYDCIFKRNNVINQTGLVLYRPNLFCFVSVKENASINKQTRVGANEATFPCSFISPFGWINQNAGYLLNVTFLFDRYHRSLAEVTSAEWDDDLTDSSHTFAKLTLPLTEESTKGILVIPNPGRDIVIYTMTIWCLMSILCDVSQHEICNVY